MHSFGHKANALLMFSLTILALMRAMASFSDNLNSPSPTASVKVLNINRFQKKLTRDDEPLSHFSHFEFLLSQKKSTTKGQQLQVIVFFSNHQSSSSTTRPAIASHLLSPFRHQNLEIMLCRTMTLTITHSLKRFGCGYSSKC